MNRMKFSIIITALLYIALGAVLLLWPDLSLKVVCYAFGGVTLLYGIVRILMYLFGRNRYSFYQANIVVGIVVAAFGVFLLMKPELVVSVLPWIIGLFIILHSFVKLQGAIELKRVGYDRWWTVLLAAALTAALGLLIVLNPFATVAMMVMVIGIVLIVDGIANIWSTLFTLHIVKKYTKQMEEAADTVNDMMHGEFPGDLEVADVEAREQDCEKN